MSAKLTIPIPVWLDKLFTWPLMLYRKRKFGYTFRRIYLSDGLYTIVEPHDYYLYGRYKWSISGNGTSFYAVRSFKVGPGKTSIISLHREIMNAPKGLVVDHENGKTLDNRLANLRLATQSQNLHNRKKMAGTSSKYLGVHYDKNRRRWAANIRHNGKKVWLGRFISEADAARAFDKAARKYHKEFATLNFPDEN